MIWALAPQPGNHHAAVWCADEHEWHELVGWCACGGATFDGQRVVLGTPCDRERLFARLFFPEPFRMPARHLHFEDVQTAVRIAETGFYSFEGALYRVLYREGGTVALDRVYAEPPRPMYHGQQLEEPRPRKLVLDLRDADLAVEEFDPEEYGENHAA